MKKGLIITGLLIMSTFVIISCESNMNTAAPARNGRLGSHLETGKISGSYAEMVMQIFALDENEEQISYKVFTDINELELILGEDLLTEMTESDLIIIKNTEKVNQIKESIFSDLHEPEYLCIENIGSLYLQDFVESIPCSWSCAKICLCCEKCTKGKDTGRAPYKEWQY